MDLTKIDRPFGLLDEATQKALRECGGPWEWFMGGRWEAIEPAFSSHVAYRLKPQPPKPREWWINYDDYSVLTYAPDDDGAFKANGYIHAREVIE